MTPSKFKECNYSNQRSNIIDPLLISTSIENDQWLEKTSLWNFRLWHIIFMFLGGFLSIVICLCCCIRFRIPRTKQEIEADYIRKKITRKFKKQLTMINNAEMDEMDLKKALDRIRAEFKSDTESIAQSEAAFSVCSINSSTGGCVGHHDDNIPNYYRKASDLGVDIETLIEQREQGIGSKLAKFMGNMNLLRTRKHQRIPKTDV